MLSSFFKSKKNIFFFSLLVISAILEIAFRASSDFSEFFCVFIAQPLRYIYTPLKLIPFAFSESLIIIAFLFLLFLMILVFLSIISIILKKQFTPPLGKVFKCIFYTFSIIAFLFSATFSSSYHRKDLNTLMHFEELEITEERLEYATLFARDRLSEISEYIPYQEGQMTSSGMNFQDLSLEVEKAVNKACKRYPFLHKNGIPAKPLALSVPMTYTHISGIYTFFTGEPCVNTNYSQYSLPFTTAHEYAHQRGIGHEDAADFMAFIILLESDNIYLHYSAWAEVYTVLSNTLYEVNRIKALEITSTLPNTVLNDYRVSVKVFDKYSDSAVGDIAQSVNDTYLKANGVEEGVHSYAESVKLIVSYICQ